MNSNPQLCIATHFLTESDDEPLWIPGDCDIVSFDQSDQPFMAINAGPLFKFNKSISFMVYCDTQEEFDYYWEKVSAVPEAERCCWLKDKYGLSWQIVPTVMDEIMQDKDEKKIARVTEAFLQMKKFDTAELKKVYLEASKI